MTPTPAEWARIQALLAAPFPDELESKGQGGKYPYIDKDQAADRLDDVVPGAWSVEHRVLDPTKAAAECTITIHGVSRSDCGYPNNEVGATAPKKEGGNIVRNEAGEAVMIPIDSTEPLKDAYTDAFRRAALRWGIGRYLSIPKRLDRARNQAKAQAYLEKRAAHLNDLISHNRRQEPEPPPEPEPNPPPAPPANITPVNLAPPTPIRNAGEPRTGEPRTTNGGTAGDAFPDPFGPVHPDQVIQPPEPRPTGKPELTSIEGDQPKRATKLQRNALERLAEQLSSQEAIDAYANPDLTAEQAGDLLKKLGREKALHGQAKNPNDADEAYQRSQEERREPADLPF